MTGSTARPPGTAVLAFDDRSASFYTVGQVSDMLSVQPAFLRRLDSEGVVTPQRSAGGQRRYTRMEIAAVQRIQLMSGEGLTLEGIRRILVLEAEVARLESALEAARGTPR